MKHRRELVILAVIFLIGATTFGTTVGYWPLSYENGVRTTTSDVFANVAGEGFAVPQSRKDNALIEGSAYCPIGTNAFPQSFGVYDPIGGTNASASTALYFHKESLNGYAGALRVENPEFLRLTTFTVECFVRMQPGVDVFEWHVIAVMPQQLKNGATTIKNCDSWGLRVTGKDKLSVRFTNEGYGINGDVIDGKNEGFDIVATTIFDGNWHHVAFSVTDGTKVHGYFDYARAGGCNLSKAVRYQEGEDLFIGDTPQTAGPFAGSIAHFRISNEALKPRQFLHFTRTEKMTGEADDVLFRASFEPVDGLSGERAVFNDMANGSALLHNSPDFSANKVPVLWHEAPFSKMYANVIDPNGRENTTSLSNAAPVNADARCYIGWEPEEDVFTNTSFTVECFYKTTLNGQWVPLMRRMGGSNVQFNLGFGTTVGCLSATVLEYYASTGGDGVKPINDTEATNDNKWHHAALVVDAEKKTVTLYRDRKKIGAKSYNGKLVPATSPITIAGSSNAYAPYKGLVDEVRIVMRALGPEEFLSPTHVDTTAKTVAWLDFEDGFAARENDVALKNPVCAAATSDGTTPTLVDSDRPGKIVDMKDHVLRDRNRKAAVFNKSVVKFGADPYLALLDSFTVEFYMKSSANEPSASIIRCNAETNGAVAAWAMSLGNGASPQTLHISAAIHWPDAYDVNRINDDTGIVIGDGKWHHIAMTVEQGSENTVIKIYKDHETTPSWTKTQTGRIYYAAAQGEIWLGASSSETAFFNGTLDEVRISKGVLTRDEFLSYRSIGMTIRLR